MNRAQKRKTELQKATDLLVKRRAAEAYAQGRLAGVSDEHARCTQVLHPADVVDLGKLNVGDRPYVRISDPPKFSRVFKGDVPLDFNLHEHTFKAQSMAITLPNGTQVCWYQWVQV